MTFLNFIVAFVVCSTFATRYEPDVATFDDVYVTSNARDNSTRATTNETYTCATCHATFTYTHTSIVILNYTIYDAYSYDNTRFDTRDECIDYIASTHACYNVSCDLSTRELLTFIVMFVILCIVFYERRRND